MGSTPFGGTERLVSSWSATPQNIETDRGKSGRVTVSDLA
jgi:hypothetical protein